MSQAPTQRSRPLISRPQRNPNSQLGNAVAGALAGINYPNQPIQQPWPPQPQWNVPQYPMAPYPMQNMQNPAYFLPNSFPFQMQPLPHYPPKYAQQPYPPTFPFNQPSYPPQQQLPQQHFQQPYFQQPHNYPSNPLPARAVQLQPRQTPEGYALSSSYTEPIPPPIVPRAPNRSQQYSGNSVASTSGSNRPMATNGSTMGKCSYGGCSFEGPRKAVREHEEDRHLIYAEGREPKPWTPSVKSAAGARIEGSNISLDSPEAIAKWIADRKKRWPSNKVVEDKETLRNERVAAGLEPASRGGRGRGRDRGTARGGRGGDGSERGRGRGRGGAMGGNGRYREEQPTEEPASKRTKLNEDASDSSSDSDDSEDDGPPIASSSKLPVPSLEEMQDPAFAKPSIHPSRLAQDGGEDEAMDSLDLPKPKKIDSVCRNWRNGDCDLGAECIYLHTLPPNPTRTLPIRRKPAPQSLPRNPFARGDPFSQLEERDVSHFTAGLLQVFSFLSNNDWLNGVELKAGEVEDGNGIEVIEEAEVEGSMIVDPDEEFWASIDVVDLAVDAEGELDVVAMKEPLEVVAVPVSE